MAGALRRNLRPAQQELVPALSLADAEQERRAAFALEQRYAHAGSDQEAVVHLGTIARPGVGLATEVLVGDLDLDLLSPRRLQPDDVHADVPATEHHTLRRVEQAHPSA